MVKPLIFIGSSTEGLGVARAVKRRLDGECEVTIWDEDFFTLSSTFIETLINSLPQFDFALLVLTTDDLITSREVESFGPRDNIIFELGLFMGKLGRSRTFIMNPRSIKIPSDLSGVTTASYDWPRIDNDIERGVGEACNKVLKAIRALGPSNAKLANEVMEIKSRQQFQEKEIESIRLSLQSMVTKYEYDKLIGLNKEGNFICHYSDNMIEELRRLRALDLISNYKCNGLREIQQKYRSSNEGFDLKIFFYLTEQGKKYLKLRDEIMND